ncbi:unnamed protein product [Alopecurus aequalis]
MAGGDPSSMEVVATEREAEEEIQEKGMNPLDPRYSEYDPKQRKYIYTRYFTRRKIDLDQECTVPFPIIFMSILVLENKPHIKDDSLVLNGPKRGFMFCDFIYFEIDLKVKDGHGRKFKDERLSKGLMEVDGVVRLAYRPIHEVETETLVSMHSILDLSYTFIRKAVEGAVEVRILGGPAAFHGKICACTTSVPCDIMLHDSKVNGVLTTGDKGVVQMARSVVGVSLDELLRLTVAAALGGAEFSVCTVEFTPRRNGYAKEEIACGGDYRILLKVTWSIIYL